MTVPVMMDNESARKSYTSPCLDLKNMSWQTSVRPAKSRPLRSVSTMACFTKKRFWTAYLHVSHVING